MCAQKKNQSPSAVYRSTNVGVGFQQALLDVRARKLLTKQQVKEGLEIFDQVGSLCSSAALQRL
jgi:hypothetical protein